MKQKFWKHTESEITAMQLEKEEPCKFYNGCIRNIKDADNSTCLSFTGVLVHPGTYNCKDYSVLEVYNLCMKVFEEVEFGDVGKGNKEVEFDEEDEDLS